MTHRLTSNYAKNYCNRTLIVKVIVENVVTCFLGHGVVCLIVSYRTVHLAVAVRAMHTRHACRTRYVCCLHSLVAF